MHTQFLNNVDGALLSCKKVSNYDKKIRFRQHCQLMLNKGTCANGYCFAMKRKRGQLCSMENNNKIRFSSSFCRIGFNREPYGEFCRRLPADDCRLCLVWFSAAKDSQYDIEEADPIFVTW